MVGAGGLQAKMEEQMPSLQIVHKSCIRDTLNLLTDADSSTNTKTKKNGQRGPSNFFVYIFFFRVPTCCGGVKFFLGEGSRGVQKISKTLIYFILFFLPKNNIYIYIYWLVPFFLRGGVQQISENHFLYIYIFSCQKDNIYIYIFF